MQANGWAVIWPFYVDYDDSPIPYTNYVDDIRTYILSNDLAYVATVTTPNGVGMLQVTNCQNHPGGLIDDLCRLFQYIGQVASGSYGQIHYWDDDGQQNRDSNAMYVILLARGSVTMHKDPFLNPCIPNVEAQDPRLPVPKRIAELIPKYLPIGSVVVLEDGDKKLMIFGRCQKDADGYTLYDYVGCPYPEGIISPRATFLFNHENVAWVHYLGYTGDEEDALNARLLALTNGD